MAKSYIELLRDPRWQKKRLEILALDYWQCRACLSKTNNLQVHHLWYEKGKNPWEYSNDALVTLCEKCHPEAKIINWKQAFLDLNLCESELLEIAAQLHFMKKKWSAETVDLQAKYKVRYNGLSTDLHILEDEEDATEYFQTFRLNIMKKYKDG